MSIAEKLTLIAENEQKVFDAGKLKERDDFWETFQVGGTRTNYFGAFRTNGWTDNIYNPKYPIIITNGHDGMFEQCLITDTKVDIIVNINALSGLFYYAQRLVTIRNLVLNVDTSPALSTFRFNNALENITITGEGKFTANINLQHSNYLTAQSMNNIIAYLKDYSKGTETKTLTLTATAKAKLSESEIAVATQKGWTVA